MQGLQQIVAFAETAKHGSFAAAARELGSAPSTLAKAVARLEQSLGVKLFHRTTRHVGLTADGERLYARCQRLLHEVEELHADAAGVRAEPSGVLRVDLPLAYGRKVLLPALSGLATRHPRLVLDVRLSDAYVDLVKEGIDVAVRAGDMRDSSLVARKFDTQQLLLLASPAYLSGHGVPQRIDQLAGHSAIVFRMPTSGKTRPWQFRQRGRAVELHPEWRLQLGDGEAIVRAAAMGLGIAQVPDYMAEDELARGELVQLLPELAPAPMAISAVYPGHRMVPPRVRAFLEMLEQLPRRGDPTAARYRTAPAPSRPRSAAKSASR
jgi:DNA-binding transcriptional LysR family regulator